MDYLPCPKCKQTYGNHSLFCEHGGRLRWLPDYLFFGAIIGITFFV